MNIAVCVKQVPDVPSIRMDRERMTIIRDGVESVINPLDYVALQAALDLRNRQGGEVVVVTMGPPQSEEALREAMAAGADRAILLTGSAFSGDSGYLPRTCHGHFKTRPISRPGALWHPDH